VARPEHPATGQGVFAGSAGNACPTSAVASPPRSPPRSRGRSVRRGCVPARAVASHRGDHRPCAGRCPGARRSDGWEAPGRPAAKPRPPAPSDARRPGHPRWPAQWHHRVPQRPRSRARPVTLPAWCRHTVLQRSKLHRGPEPVIFPGAKRSGLPTATCFTFVSRPKSRRHAGARSSRKTSTFPDMQTPRRERIIGIATNRYSSISSCAGAGAASGGRVPRTSLA
jgi:hypothetical protein